MSTSVISPAELADSLRTLRAQTPLVQCLTNIVAAQWTANVLLAAGAAPAMVDNPEEAGVFAGVSSGVLVNTGTPYKETYDAMRVASAAAHSAGTPWVLDPVAAGGLPVRTAFAVEVLANRPMIIRGNASEISGLSGGAGGRGADSTAAPQEVLDLAHELARSTGAVVAVSGAVDHITDGERLVRIHNGHEVMTRVTGVGCSLGGLMAGFAGVSEPLLAASAATALICVAADNAVATSQGPGSFAAALLDQLALVTPEELEEKVRLS
ncbi:hydroxyethylthiazole kinase [Luteococcus japonicus]|uniref:Hydroxyethylthiazole kinase n=2 Tax=Luteococcus japonicus TaxID=33984 RepID=A0A1R4JH76_9ACTN|nr:MULTISPECIES: hydroxyethylthiazole kinase [Luteococcus]MDN5564575.1 hydroxyethylthiazole kinase [Luteococcus sp.]ROR54439.1 hydroxyethylthiazole kinase [Luteococcus japonicus]SJN31369.1 Hydroxyethylthiazole kinase [Luteococcus japonicus LSP_Lj1]